MTDNTKSRKDRQDNGNPSSINEFWLPLWYLVAIAFSVLPRFTTSDYPFGILWPLYCLSFLDFVLSVIPRFTTSDYPFGIFWPLYCLSFLDLRLLITPLVSCGHFIVCPSSIYDFWLPFWYLVAIACSVLPRRYQRGNQNSLIEEAQTIQRPQDTKGVIRSRKSRRERQYNGHKIQKG
jgi:hypothetical protein